MVFIVELDKFNCWWGPGSRRRLMVQPLRLKMCILRSLRLKLGMLQPLRLKVGMLRLCATEETLCDYVQPKEDMLLLFATQIRYVGSLCGRNICATLSDSKLIFKDIVRFKKRCVANIATQNGCVAFLCNQNICVTLRDPKQICCNFPGRSLQFMFRPTGPKNGMFQPS